MGIVMSTGSNELSETNYKESFLYKNRFNFMVLVGLINYFCIHFFVMPHDFARKSFYDDGWMSIFTMVMMLGNAVVIMWLAATSKTRKEVISFLMLLCVNQVYALREADFHTAFATTYKVHSVTKLKYYYQPDIPLLARVIPAVILILFFLSVLFLLKQYYKTLFKTFFEWNAATWAFCMWGGILFLSQVLDRVRYFHDATNWKVASLEEALEVSASVFAFTAIVTLAMKLKNSRCIKS
jgi:hypothetical protein